MLPAQDKIKKLEELLAAHSQSSDARTFSATPTVYPLLSELYLQVGNGAKSLEYAEKAHLAYSVSAGVMLDQARLLIALSHIENNQNLEEAARIAETVVQTRGRAREVLPKGMLSLGAMMRPSVEGRAQMILGLVAWKKDDSTEANTLLRRAFELSQTMDPLPAMRLGQFLLDTGEMKQALYFLAVASVAVGVNPSNADWSETARLVLEEAYKQVHGSLDGLETLLVRAEKEHRKKKEAHQASIREFWPSSPREGTEQAALNKAMQNRDPVKRAAAFEEFIEEFPNSRSKEKALFEIARATRDRAARQLALQNFLKDFPHGSFKERAAFELAQSSDREQRQAALEKFLEDFPDSTMRPQAYRLLFTEELRRNPVDEAKLQRVIDAYLESESDIPMRMGPWAINRRADAANNISERLARKEQLRNQALVLAETAVSSITRKTRPENQSRYRTNLGYLLYLRQEYDLAEAQLAKALAIKGSGSSRAHLYLGKIYEFRDDHDRALSQFLQGASLGRSRELKKCLENAYIKKHGSLEGLHPAIDSILLSKEHPFDPGRYEPASEHNPDKVVLAELFTGAECRPCVAADLAFAGLEKHYSRRQLILLEYHLHIPGPDPMTNRETVNRSRYYGARGTPATYIDGAQTVGGGGSEDQAESTFRRYKTSIRERLSQAPRVQLSLRPLDRNSNRLTVSGEVVIDKPVPNARLRLVLSEKVVHYTGGNGIHFHHFVVRQMLGKPKGLDLGSTTGRLEFSESVNFEALEAGLRDDLDEYELKRSGFKWMERLDSVDRNQLAVVALVQDDETKEVLQAAFMK